MKIIPFYNTEAERQRYVFINKPVLIQRDSGSVQFPCIVLYHKDQMVPVAYPCFERWYFRLNVDAELASTTMRKRASVMCSFLNFMLSNTKCAYIHDLSLNDIRDFLVWYQTTERGNQRSNQTWYEGVALVYDFLGNYYIHHKGLLDFSYKYEDLITVQRIQNSRSSHKRLVKQYNYLSVKAPKQLTKKNRMLLYGYIDLLLFEAEMYDPEIALGIAMQAYAGAREGEVVNLCCSRVDMGYAGFGRVGDITLDFSSPAPFIDQTRKTPFGKIKVFRKQKVYPHFNDIFIQKHEAHIARMESMGYSVTGDVPLFHNKNGGAMSVQTYTGRVKKLFYMHFLPDLKRISREKGSWAIDAPYIEAFEADYPGAHAFRHWFTMYLFQHARLSSDEISKWRGDRNRDSMLTYLHIHADMLEAFKSAAHIFQRSWLEEST